MDIKKDLFNPKYIKFIPLLLFFILFLVGVNIFKDYGAPIDDEFHRLMGFYWLKYVLEFFPESNIYAKVSSILENINIFNYNVNSLAPVDLIYGVVFDLPLAILETLFNITDQGQIYLTRHLSIFIIFFISLIFFYKILIERFDILVGIIGTSFLVLSPRIFAQSFYNSKDIIFMSLIIISLYFLYKTFKNFNFYNYSSFSLFAALSTATRGIGIILFLIFLISIFLSSLSKFSFFSKNYKKVLWCSILYIFFSIIFWPYLWSDPIKNFIQAITMLSNHILEIYLLFDSDFIRSTNVPWYYLPKWLTISTPLVYIVFIFLGISLSLSKIFKRFILLDKEKETNHDDLWKNFHEKFDLHLLIFLIGTLMIIISNDATLYNGWRHIYFLYPIMIYFAAYAVNFYFKKIKLKNFLITIIFLNSLFMINTIYKLHPFQGIYFNILAGNEIHKRYEIDYWGLSNLHFLKKLIKIEKKESINIGVASWTTLNRSLPFLSDGDRNRIRIVGQEYDAADYILNNFIYEVNKNYDDKYDIPDNFIKIDELNHRNTKIYEIYKRKN